MIAISEAILHDSLFANTLQLMVISLPTFAINHIRFRRDTNAQKPQQSIRDANFMQIDSGIQ